MTPFFMCQHLWVVRVKKLGNLFGMEKKITEVVYQYM